VPLSRAEVSTIGIISDTHGLLRPQAVAALQGCEHILHAGDVGDPQILSTLETIAPVDAIRGNIDSAELQLPETLRLTLGGKTFYLLHDVKALAIDPAVEDIDVVVSGHSHKPHHYNEKGVTFFNPGAAGKRRFRLPITLAVAKLEPESINFELIDLLAVSQ